MAAHERPVPWGQKYTKHLRLFDQCKINIFPIIYLLKNRGNQAYEDMSKTWKLHKIQFRNYQPTTAFDNKMHEEIHKFYWNLTNYAKLINYARKDTEKKPSDIEDVEGLKSTEDILKFFDEATKQVGFTLSEAEDLMDKLNIEKPDIGPTDIDFDKNYSRPTRDFLIFRDLIEELESVLKLVDNYCKNNAEE
ncbi:hypothetical protein DOY81_007462 [Sarcophaga bullata]|nr:hypothetical protein DOY81_007462 [Sarcophaga bullata]